MADKMSLLDKARNISPREIYADNFTNEDFELVEAWLAGEITMKQVIAAKKLGSGSAGAYCYIARCCRSIWQLARKEEKK